MSFFYTLRQKKWKLVIFKLKHKQFMMAFSRLLNTIEQLGEM